MSYKSKSKSNTLAELHFISSVQLEEAVYLLEAVTDDAHSVMLIEVSPDEFQFQIAYKPENAKLAEISGTLQRWNGTNTKIDANGAVMRLETGEETSNAASGVISATVAVFIGMGIAAASGQVWLIVPIILAGSSYAYMANSTAGEQEKPQTVLFRHRDYLLQILIDVFKSAGDVQAI